MYGKHYLVASDVSTCLAQAWSGDGCLVWMKSGRRNTALAMLRTVFSVPANVRRRRLHSMKRGREGSCVPSKDLRSARSVIRGIMNNGRAGVQGYTVRNRKPGDHSRISHHQWHLESKQRFVAQSNDIPMRTKLKCQRHLRKQPKSLRPRARMDIFLEPPQSNFQSRLLHWQKREVIVPKVLQCTSLITANSRDGFQWADA
ncbi:hypothetical protein KC367_g223 [Hortaea werneckii]|nr:hypothetical protein KC367_g223 [Hortaea werneckii]